MSLRLLLSGFCVAAMGYFGLRAAEPYGLEERPPFSAFLGNRMPEAGPTLSGNWSAVVAFPNLTFLNPMGLLPVPGTRNLVVYEREGRIYQFPNDRNTSSKTLVLDIRNQVQGWDDSGLMGIAFHPGFETNRHLFIYYTYVSPGTVRGSSTARPPTSTPNRDRLERYTLDENGVAIPGSVTIFIDQRSETVWHNGGGMFFHPGTASSTSRTVTMPAAKTTSASTTACTPACCALMWTGAEATSAIRFQSSRCPAAARRRTTTSPTTIPSLARRARSRNSSPSACAARTA
jgi:hypothetical protein